MSGTDAGREERAARLAADREDRSEHLAYERGRREQQVDSRLDGHDRHLAAINGSIERGAKATERVEEKVEGLAQQIREEGAVGRALAKHATDAMSRSISRKDAWVAMGVIVAMLLGTLVTALIAVLGH